MGKVSNTDIYFAFVFEFCGLFMPTDPAMLLIILHSYKSIVFLSLLLFLSLKQAIFELVQKLAKNALQAAESHSLGNPGTNTIN